MQYILSPAARPALEELARQRTLCAFDFDGTLAPIVEHPDDAVMPDRTNDLLGRVAAVYPCIVLSGRARSDLVQRLDGIKLERVIGNHGAETERPHRMRRRRIEKWRTAIENGLEGLPGVWVEDKGLSLAVHYRQSAEKVEARQRVLQLGQGLEGAHLFGGKQVVNVVDGSAPDKGAALMAERDRLHCNWVIFAGDDENDEDAFAIGGNLISVRVGRKQSSRARYYLRAQSEIDKLMELLVELRSSECR